MHKALYVLTVFLAFCSCEPKDRKQEKSVISWSGNLPEHCELKMVEQFKIDSVQFADGMYKYFLQGAILMGKEECIYSLMLTNRPLEKGQNKVIDWNFPLEKIDTTAYNCSFKQTKGGYWIKWTNSENELRIFIREKLISER